MSEEDENILSRSGTTIIPGCLMNIGEPISAFFALSTKAKTVPKLWKPDQRIMDAVEKMVKSKARQEKKREEVLLTAVETVADVVAQTVLKESRSSGLSLRQEALLRAAARLS
jgi:hypothetical protein